MSSTIMVKKYVRWITVHASHQVTCITTPFLATKTRFSLYSGRLSLINVFTNTLASHDIILEVLLFRNFGTLIEAFVPLCGT